MTMSNDLSVWIAALVTIGLISFVFKENLYYRIVESLYVGVSAGHAIVLGWGNIRNLAVRPLGEGNLAVIIPIALGLMLFTRYFQKWSRVSRIPMGFLMGLGAGLSMRGLVGSQIVNQIKACYLPLNSMNNILIIAGTFAVLATSSLPLNTRGLSGNQPR